MVQYHVHCTAMVCRCTVMILQSWNTRQSGSAADSITSWIAWDENVYHNSHVII